jgi:capsular exopolysaccharide synthesis family protein
MTQRRAPSRPHTSAHSKHVSDYLRIIYKRRWTAVLGLLVVFVSGAFKSLRTTPIYQATTQVQIEMASRGSGTISSVVEAQQGFSFVEEDFYQTQYRILQSRALAWKAITSLGLQPTTKGSQPALALEPSWFQKTIAWSADLIGAAQAIAPPPADETTAQSESIDGFLGGLSVEPVRNTRLVLVKYRSADPLFAARAANAVAEEYRAQNMQASFMASKETNAWLAQELDAQRKVVEASDRKLQEYKESHDAAAVGDRQNIVVARLGDLNAELTRAKTERYSRESLYLSLQSAQAAGADLDAFPSLGTNDLVGKLKIQLNDLQQERVKMLDTYLAVSPDVQQKERQIAAVKAELTREIGKVIESARIEFEAAKGKEMAHARALEEAKKEQLGLGRKEVEYASIEREAAGNRQLYDNLLQMAKQTGVTKQYNRSNISVIDAAEVPRAPILPRRSRDLSMAFMGGCLLALALVFGFEYMDSRIKTPDDIKAHLGLSFLGIVPTVKADGPILLDGTATPAFAEALRAVRTSVIFSSADEGARTIVVTSTAPHEGKTSVATNLACALAQTEQRTIVIDADMRRPRVHEVFARPQEPGLSNVLVGTTRLKDAILVSSVPHLSVLAAGHLPPNPAELLGSNKYIEILDELQQQFDWIVIDAPPVMAVTDAAVIAHNATGVMFVVGAEMTPRRNAIAAVEQLTAARARFIGAVLNRVNIQKHSYYYAPYYRKDYSRAYERAAR